MKNIRKILCIYKACKIAGFLNDCPVCFLGLSLLPIIPSVFFFGFMFWHISPASFRFWNLLLPYLYTHRLNSFPIQSSFSEGFGNKFFIDGKVSWFSMENTCWFWDNTLRKNRKRFLKELWIKLIICFTRTCLIIQTKRVIS